MNRSTRYNVLTAAIVAIFTLASVATATEPIPTKKQTSLGLYVNAQEAYDKWQTQEGSIHIIDVRTPAECVFVGHAPMAKNIPSMFFSHRFNAEEGRPVLNPNPLFLKTIEAQHDKHETIFLMCRSGGRSSKAVDILAEAGYTNVYSIIDGFEGDKVKDAQSPDKGKRVKNGWKNSGAPWTYKLDSELIYQAEPVH